MQRRIAPLVAAALAAGLLTISGPGPATAEILDKVNLIGLTADNQLVTLASDALAEVSAPKAIEGLEADDADLLGIDVRPATGQLYVLGKTNIYTVDPATAKATKVGTEAFDPPLEGTAFGIDFDPVLDRIRVVSDTGQNLRLDPTDGTVASESDARLAFHPGDEENSTATPQVTGAAYTNSLPGSVPEETTLFDIDTGLDALLIQGPAPERDPNRGELVTVGTLDVGDVTAVNGFDIDVAPGVQDGKPATAPVALAALDVAGVTGLYTIDLNTGKATIEGNIGDGTLKLKGLAVAPVDGYWLFGADGAVYPFGDGDNHGEPKSIPGGLAQPIINAAASPSGEGYWIVGSDGGIFNYGDAPFYGSTGAMTLNKPVVAVAPYADGNGYWLVASDGGIFSFPKEGTPDRFYGSMGGIPLNKPVVGMAVYPNGNGYWLVAEDGGIFSFFDKDKSETDRFYGSTGDITLNQPIKGMAPYPDGTGYWFVADDGGVFSYASGQNTPRFFGSLPERKLTDPAKVVGMASTPSGQGYWLAGADGAVHIFGDAKDHGNATTPKPAKPVVAIAPVF